jgi:hypothetical protein
VYNYNVEFVLERMVIITSVEIDEPDTPDDAIIQVARQNILDYYKIDPETLYLQDVIVHEA